MCFERSHVIKPYKNKNIYTSAMTRNLAYITFAFTKPLMSKSSLHPYGEFSVSQLRRDKLVLMRTVPTNSKIFLCNS